MKQLRKKQVGFDDFNEIINAFINKLNHIYQNILHL